ncbi:hypothetical protein ACFL2V_06625 [Pseudomonadota bacterium]
MKNKYIKLLLTFVLVVAGGLIASQVLDERGQEYTNDALKRSLVTFGVARALNGVISVAQGTEIALQPAGVGMTFTPGQILDPVNDIVERFSWVMLMSSASIGIQKTLLTISAWSWFSGAALLTFLVAIVTLWLPKLQHHPVTPFVLKLALLALVLRLSVPCIAIMSEWVYQGFLAPQYNEATAQLQQTTDNIGRINQQSQQNTQPTNAPDSIWDAAKQLYESATDSIDIEAQLEQYKKATAEASEHLVSLVVVFIFQTVLLPLIFLAGLYALLKRLVNTRLFL